MLAKMRPGASALPKFISSQDAMIADGQERAIPAPRAGEEEYIVVRHAAIAAGRLADLAPRPRECRLELLRAEKSRPTSKSRSRAAEPGAMAHATSTQPADARVSPRECGGRVRSGDARRESPRRSGAALTAYAASQFGRPWAHRESPQLAPSAWPCPAAIVASSSLPSQSCAPSAEELGFVWLFWKFQASGLGGFSDRMVFCKGGAEWLKSMWKSRPTMPCVSS